MTQKSVRLSTVEKFLPCRALLTDAQLLQVLALHPALKSFKMCSCSRVTDAALEALPAGSLRELRLFCCDGVEGRSLSRLRKLETLELSSCNAITVESIQVGMPCTGAAVISECCWALGDFCCKVVYGYHKAALRRETVKQDACQCVHVHVLALGISDILLSNTSRNLRTSTRCKCQLVMQKSLRFGSLCVLCTGDCCLLHTAQEARPPKAYPEQLPANTGDRPPQGLAGHRGRRQSSICTNHVQKTMNSGSFPPNLHDRFERSRQHNAGASPSCSTMGVSGTKVLMFDYYRSAADIVQCYGNQLAAA